MLAPMQGLTNRALRSYFVDTVQPDTVFTEFVRVNPAAAKKLIAAADLREMCPAESGVPLVVQLIGHSREPLVSAAQSAQAAGAVHLNLNMGCPYGRMTTGLTGGGMLKRPELLTELIPALREVITGTFSVKIRAGYDDPRQILSLFPLFEQSGVDFLILHPRTVLQEYRGTADHTITAELVRQSTLPVIANGDIRTAADGQRVLRETGAAGLMLGRGAIADPLLFHRLRGSDAAEPSSSRKHLELQRYLHQLLPRYRAIFCGEMQVLGKMKAVLAQMADEDLERVLKELRKSKTLTAFCSIVDRLAA
jgi:tRNA-dihydrouridine synthase